MKKVLNNELKKSGIMKRSFLTLCLSTALILGSFTSVVSAKSLAKSFYGGTSVNPGATQATKFCWGGTSGYSGNHYVRAYIGGSKNSANGALVDTGRRYSSGDIKTQCALTYVSKDKDAHVFTFPTGYSKCGN